MIFVICRWNQIIHLLINKIDCSLCWGFCLGLSNSPLVVRFSTLDVSSSIRDLALTTFPDAYPPGLSLAPMTGRPDMLPFMPLDNIMGTDSPCYISGTLSILWKDLKCVCLVRSGPVRSVPIEFPRMCISVNPRNCTYAFPRRCISTFYTCIQ